MHRIQNTFLFVVLLFFVSACQASQPEQVSPEDLLAEPIAVTLNPNDITPLAAEAVFTTTVPTQVTITVTGEEPMTHEFEEVATEHRIPILGLYPDTDNSVEILITEPGERYAEETLSITTEPLPDFFPDITVETAEQGRMEPGWTLSDFSVGDNGTFRTHPFFFDNNGEVRWYIDTSFTGGMIYLIKRLENGNLIFSYGTTVYEHDMLGNEINRWEIPGYTFHHEIEEKPDGNLILAVNKAGADTIEDYAIEIDRTSGEVVKEWDFRQMLDRNRTNYDPDERDWLHVNAIFYVEADNSIIISGRNQGLAKITYDDEVVWILAPHKGWGNAGPDGEGEDTSQYLLTALDEDGNPYPDAVQQGDEEPENFGWVWGQHAPMLLPSGNLFVFDNGLKRTFDAEARPHYSRGVEYKIDEEALTVEQVWQYGKERGEEYHSAIISDVDYLPETGNRLVMPGIIRPGDEFYAHVTEVTYPDAEVVFDAKIQFKNLLTDSPEKGFGYIDAVYRSERLPLYP